MPDPVETIADEVDVPRTKREPVASQPASETFESLFAALEERTRKLEQGNLSLDDSLRIADESAGLVEKLHAILDSAELKVTEIRAKFEGGPPLSEEIDYFTADDDEEVPF